MYINRRHLKKKHKKSKAFRLLTFGVIEILLCIVFLGILLLVFHKQTPRLIRPFLTLAHTISGMQGDDRAAIEKLLNDQHIPFTSVQVASESAYIITLPNGEQAVVTSEKDLGAQIGSLQVILNRLTMEGKRFSRLDLRFEKPVIVAK